MATMDIFTQSAFDLIELTLGLEKLPYQPGLIRSLGLFAFRGIRTRQFGIEEREGTLTLIPFSDPDAPATVAEADNPRTVRDFRTRHFGKEDKVRASEVAGIRAFGTESEFQQVQGEVARRAQRLRNEAELTFEFHALNALQGKVLDPGKVGNAAVVYDWFREFGISPAEEIDFDLDNASPTKGALRKKCNETVQAMEEDAGGLSSGTLSVEAICGTAFFNDLTSHPNIIDAWMFAAKVAEQAGRPADSFSWGGITWRRYRAGSGVGVNTDKAYLYPVGIPDLFQQYASPYESLPLVNSPGQEVYYFIEPDSVMQRWVKLHLKANPMFICTRPKLLRVARRT